MIRESIKAFIENELLSPPGAVRVADDDDLLTVGTLSSMQFMRLIAFVEKETGLSVPPEDMVLENFQTVGLIDDYLTRRVAGA